MRVEHAVDARLARGQQADLAVQPARFAVGGAKEAGLLRWQEVGRGAEIAQRRRGEQTGHEWVLPACAVTACRCTKTAHQSVRTVRKKSTRRKSVKFRKQRTKSLCRKVIVPRDARPWYTNDLKSRPVGAADSGGRSVLKLLLQTPGPVRETESGPHSDPKRGIQLGSEPHGLA